MKDLEDPEEARLKGNEHFKALSSCGFHSLAHPEPTFWISLGARPRQAGRHAEALAHYAPWSSLGPRH